MAVVHEDMPPEDATPADASVTGDAAPPARSRRDWRLPIAVLSLLAVSAIAVAWVERERLLRGYLADQIERAGLLARFRIVSIDTGGAVLADVVVGDPAHPDLTVDRVQVAATTRFGIPAIGQFRLVHPRLHGSYRGGVLSFGSLDKLLFGPATTRPAAGLPDLDLALEDARAAILLDRGQVNVTANGAGNLRDGFAGRLLATAPAAGVAGCDGRGLLLDQRVTVSAGKPQFAGPLRFDTLSCAGAGVSLGASRLGIAGNGSAALDRFEGTLVGNGADARFAGGRARALRGTVRLAYGRPGATVRYDLAADDLVTPQVVAHVAGTSGVLRLAHGSSRLVADGSISGVGLAPGASSNAMLGRAIAGAQGTLAVPLLERLRHALQREGPASTLAGEYLLRRDDARLAVVVPRLDWRTVGGVSLLTLTRLQLGTQASGPASLSGGFATGGPDMPRIAGTIARTGRGGGFTLHAAMARYDAGSASIALPGVTLVGTPAVIGFGGEALISGDLPGGAARGLVLPIAGNWNRRTGLSVWPRCTQVRFDALRFANLTLDARSLQLCPTPGGAIVRRDARGLRIAAGTPALALTGRLGATPIRLRTGAVGFAMPGVLTARAVDVALGPEGQASRFVIANLDARIGRDIAGRFAGSQIRLVAVPLDMVEAGGIWRYADDRLTIADGALRLVDREPVARFQPLVARGATLSLANNRIVADAVLREPASDREVLRTHIVHDLAKGTGDAGLFVDALTFDKLVQPDTLTRLALGVVANAAGTVRGTGHIAWNAQGVSSVGSFSTDSLDLAAVFGPAKGIAGTIVFTDLLGLVTVPHQSLQIASVNPGIEATDGVVTYALRPGHVLAIEGGQWPFLGGRLAIEPATMTIGAAETRRFTLVIEALDAARLIQQMDVGNLAATGVFDGRLPLVIDQDGSRIDGGALRSRAPGGNVSYVGALTYKDLSTMANFAFDALRSLDYRQMSVGIDGPLSGELVTRLQFSGVTQGAGARRNFLTERIARLPIQFNVNVRAPFLQLVSSFRSLWDPSFIRDPRDLGLVAPDGTRVPPPAPRPTSPSPSSVTPPAKVQPSASGPVR